MWSPVDSYDFTNRTSSKADLGPQSHAQIVVAAVIKVDVIPGFQSNANRPCESFDSCRGIQSKIRLAVVQAYGTLETCWGVLVVDGEIVKAHFAGHEEAKGSRAGLEFRTKASMQSAELCVYQLYGHAIREILSEVPFEIVGHFRFQLYVSVHVEGGTASHTNEISCRRCLAEAEIISEGADFDVVGMLLRQQHRSRKK